jgi:hypothetical protein
MVPASTLATLPASIECSVQDGKAVEKRVERDGDSRESKF